MKISLEELKRSGEAPEWLSDEGYSVISRGYLLPDETPKTAWKRVVSGKIHSHLGSDRADRVFSYLWKGWLGLASPVFSNLNTTRGLPISCYSIHVPDSIIGIADSNKELMALAKHGGGVGVYWGDVRPRGSLIQGGANGASEGVIPFMHIQDSVTLATNQGCYDHETEILTESGWITFPELKNFPEIKVAQLTDKGDLSFTKYTDYIEYGVKEDLYYFTNKTKSVDLLVTGNHRMMIEKRRNVSYKRGLDGKYINSKKYFNGHLECKLAEDFKPHRDNKIWVASKSKSGSKETLSMLDRFLIAYQADGSTGRVKDSTGEKTGTVIYSFRFKKQRKIDRLKMILDSLEFKYSENKQTDGSTTILVRIPLSIKISKELKDVFSLDCMSKNYATEFINEISLWDGSVCNNMMSSAITYSCVIESNVDFVQSVSVISGKMSRKKNIGRKEESHQDRYYIYICDRDSVGGEDLTRSRVYYEGNVYCVTVPTGILIVRRNGSVAVCGNSVRRGASAAYLPIEHGDAEEFIRMRKPSGDINRQNLNIHHGVTVGDDFMRSLTDSSHVKHKHNRTLWLELLKTRLETGEPYIMFRDTVNNNTPDCYKKNNLKVETSNLCLSGDTKVLTQSFDFVSIKDLVGREVSIFDGENWTLNSSFRKTQDSAILYRIRLSSGSYVDATDNHRWFVKVDDSLLEKRTISLQVGDSLETSIYSKHESIKILSIEKLEGTHEVYCTTVPSTTKFALANGLMTGNCSEILLHTDDDNSFVCCLSSVNLDKYDEWKNDSMFIKDCIWFLDAVIEEFIDKASSIEGFERAISFAKNSRALGLGVLGYHSLLQRKSLPFDSFESMMLNSEIFRKLQTESLAGSRELALMYGEPEWCKGFGIRNSHQLAIAPTATNSVISGGVSPGIEPIIANAFLQKTAKGVFLKKNPSLVTVLEKYGKNDEDVWKDIAVTGGSVQHLDFLSELEKEVFKTAYEINQVAIIKQAASRQKYIDQGQSLNIFVPHNIDAKLYHLLHMEAWKSGVKTLYYSRATSALSGHSVASNINLNECKACEG